MRYDIHLLGLNHRSASVEVRELFAVKDPKELEKLILSKDRALREVAVLSTCNRVEILMVCRSGSDPVSLGLEAWGEVCGHSWQRLKPHLYMHQGLDAVTHLFRVASSLDSMILGEPQILGQLKGAYRNAVEAGATGVIINRLMHKAFSVAKRVRTETEIGSSAVSVSYAAVELAKRIFGELKGARAMLVGAGEMAELAATHLLGAGVKEILVANRTFERAVELAGRFRGQAIGFGELIPKLPEVDIIISSTGAPQTIIKAKDIKDVIRKRKNKPMFFIDIAVPRDIDPDVNSLDNVYLYDIDDLREVVEENQAQRQGEADKAHDIVAAEVSKFDAWLKSLDLQPTIVDLLARNQRVARKELKKTLRRLGPDISDETKEAIEIMAYSISRKLCHEPMVFLKRRAEEEDAADKFIDLTRRMFNLDDEFVPDDAHEDRKPGEMGDGQDEQSGPECI